MNSKDLQKYLNQTFHLKIKNLVFYEQALTHRSYLNETKKSLKSYERLEFFGDAILSFYVSQIIYDKFPDLPEGDLTNLRSSVVKTDSLAKLAKEIGLGSYLFLSKGEEESGGRENNSILTDCFEAIIAAIFLDLGLENTKEALNPFLQPLIEENYAKKQLKDYKSLLQEEVQEKYQTSPSYPVIKTEGPDHHKLFTVEVKIGNQTLGIGNGYSKQRAEQEAARHALEMWKK